MIATLVAGPTKEKAAPVAPQKRRIEQGRRARRFLLKMFPKAV
jgi:hypothetical protein